MANTVQWMKNNCPTTAQWMKNNCPVIVAPKMEVEKGREICATVSGSVIVKQHRAET